MNYKELTKQSGIYKIVNIINGKFYIGSTCNFRRRCSEYLCGFRKNKIHNKYLYNSFLKYGLENFKFLILDICNLNELLEKEKTYITSLKPDFNLDFNIVCNRNALQLEDYKKLKRQQLINTELKLGVRISKLRKVPFNGEFAGNSKLTEVQVLEIIDLINNNYDDTSISIKYNITREAIVRIRNGKNWKHLSHLILIKHSSKDNRSIRLTKENIQKILLDYKESNDYNITAKNFNLKYQVIYKLINKKSYEKII